jgi:hypothetical protein
MCPTKFSGVGFCPTKFKLCPTKIKSVGQMSCQVKYLFAALAVLQGRSIFNRKRRCQDGVNELSIFLRKGKCLKGIK